MTIYRLLLRYSGEVGRFASKLSQPNVGLYNKQLRGISVSYGSLSDLSARIRHFVEESAELCQPDHIHICDGSDAEANMLVKLMVKQGTLQNLPKYENCWLALTDPVDTARVEGKTFICTDQQSEAIPTPKPGVKGTLGNWISPADMDKIVKERFAGSMKGYTMYVTAYSMGPVESPLAKIGVQLTDSPYVVGAMRVMTRMGKAVWDKLHDDKVEYVKCLHALGTPADGVIKTPFWRCDPDRTIILHRPKTNEIISYGSGYGGNSLLGKKCLALRIGSTIGKREGWLAEHMLILGITNPRGQKRYIAAAFPSQCGKTNLAMMTPPLPGYKIECIGDDIAWMRFNEKGELRAINPENGFFGVCPGTSTKSNPIAMQIMFRNTIFTNVAKTSDGGVFWEGLEDEIDHNLKITDWKNKPWQFGSKTPASHPNARFCSPAKQCPIMDPAWESPEGVPISAILFGGRRPRGVPLVYEARDWKHGVFIGASVSSEATAAAEHKGRKIMHDPFAMRPFFGYNFGKYIEHWLSMEKPSRKLPKIFHVNWFRRDSNNKFLWPGYGENARVLEWIIRRVEGEDVGVDTPIGLVPKKDTIHLEGLSNINQEELFSIPKDFWKEEVAELEKYFDEQLYKDCPAEIHRQLNILKERVNAM